MSTTNSQTTQGELAVLTEAIMSNGTQNEAKTLDSPTDPKTYTEPTATAKQAAEENGKAVKLVGKMNFVAPEDCTLITDPADPLYENRAVAELDPEFVDSIRINGVDQPVTLSKRGSKWVVVAGRQRVRAALKVNAERRAEGVAPIKIPYVVREGAENDLIGMKNRENAQRVNLHPLDVAMQAKHALDRGMEKRRVMSDLRIGSEDTLNNYIRTLKLTDRVKLAWRTGILPDTEAYRLAKLDPAVQDGALDDGLKKTGKTLEEIVAQQADKAANTSSGDMPTDNPKGDKDLAATRKAIKAAAREAAGTAHALPGKKQISQYALAIAGTMRAAKTRQFRNKETGEVTTEPNPDYGLFVGAMLAIKWILTGDMKAIEILTAHDDKTAEDIAMAEEYAEKIRKGDAPATEPEKKA